jgi:hypothetical protein
MDVIAVNAPIRFPTNRKTSMSVPKRHHWWPQLQSRHWVNANGNINAVRRDGTSFAVNPRNIGLEGDMYTRYDLTGEKDLTIERWFSSEIEGPFANTLDYLSTIPGLTRERFRAEPEKEETAKYLGFIVNGFRQTIILPSDHRLSLAKYLAALIVRNPVYLTRIQQFHIKNGTGSSLGGTSMPPDKLVKTVALDNMLKTFDQYGRIIVGSQFVFLKRECANEFLFSDAGIIPEEPWLAGPIPFDVYAPLTPDLAVSVLPVPNSPRADRALFAQVNSRGVSRLNRNAIGQAERFVFSRSEPPVDFIKSHFGNPSPKSIGHRLVNGKLEITFDRERDAESHL